MNRPLNIRRPGFIALFICLCFFLASCAMFSTDLKTADEHFQAKNFTLAYQAYETLYITDSNNMDALTGMAICRLNMGQVKKARAMFLGVLRHDPSHSGALDGLSQANKKTYERLTIAWAKYHEEDYHGARNDFQAMADDENRLLPETQLWRIQLGIGYTYYGTRDSKKAKAFFRKSLEMKPNAESHKGIGMVEYQDGHYPMAIESFNISLHQNPNQYDIFALAALSYLNLGKDSIALDLFNKVIENDPRHLSSDDFFQGIKDRPTFTHLFSTLGWALFHKQLFTESLLVFETGINEGDDMDPDLFRGAGYAAFSLEDYGRAVDYSILSLGLAPDLPPVLETVHTPGQVEVKFFSDARTTLAWSYYHLNHLESAQTLFDTSVTLHPDWPDPHSGLGWVCFAQKEYARAHKLFLMAIEFNPDYRDAHSGIAALENIQ